VARLPINGSIKRLAWIVVALIGPTLGLGFGQGTQDIKTIFDGIAKTYTNPQQYDLVIETTIEQVSAAGVKQVDKKTMRIAARHPNKIRLETSDAGSLFGMATSTAGGLGPMIVVGDGTDLWGLFPKLNQYKKMDTSDGPMSDPSAMLKYLESGLLTGFTMVQESATLIREETISIGGTTADCFVIQIAQSPSGEAATWWVEKKRFVLRRIHSEQEPSRARPFRESVTGEFPVAHFGIVLPDSTFVFTPPNSAKQVYGPIKAPDQ
jgi:outer membrane lipoprotein-sorting protein